MLDAKARADSRLRALLANAVGQNPFGTGRLDVKDVEDFVTQVIEASVNAAIAEMGTRVKDNLAHERLGFLRIDLAEALTVARHAADDAKSARQEVAWLRGKVGELGQQLAPPALAPEPAPAAPEWEVWVTHCDRQGNTLPGRDVIGHYPSEAEADRVASLLNTMTSQDHFFQFEQV